MHNKLYWFWNCERLNFSLLSLSCYSFFYDYKILFHFLSTFTSFSLILKWKFYPMSPTSFSKIATAIYPHQTLFLTTFISDEFKSIALKIHSLKSNISFIIETWKVISIHFQSHFFRLIFIKISGVFIVFI